MTSERPNSERTLAYLATIPVDQVKGVGAARRRALEKAGITSVAEFLMHTPKRYLDRSHSYDIAAAPFGEETTVGGSVTSFSRRRISGGRTMLEARVTDGTSNLRAVWFNKYMNDLDVGEEVLLAGKIDNFRGSRQMSSPDIQRLGQESMKTARVVPVYPAVGGLKPWAVMRAVDNAVRRSLPITDVVPESILTDHRLVDRTTAFRDIHVPDELRDVGPARTRLVFDEFLRIQTAFKVREHDEYENQRGVPVVGTGELTRRFRAQFPFDLTDAQEAALESIRTDMAAPTPMHRLLQGEVGSGKTIVVVLALLTAVEDGHQGAVMAPTEVLATQHYLGTARILEGALMAPEITDPRAAGTGSLFSPTPSVSRPVRIGLFTGSRVTVNFVEGDIGRDQGLAWLADGTIDIAFGTQALIQGDVELRSLGVAVVDEQHRFGVEQRVQLRSARADGAVPDLLLMTATPIPRTLAMALYGDLKVSAIMELPAGRSPIATAHVPEGSTGDARTDDLVREVVAEGRQVFVVCPLVSDSDKIDARSAEAEYRRIAAAHPSVTVGLLHGQMSSVDKASVMERVRCGEIQVLVSTTVIEVGIDVPNATLIVIRNAERFGLSQLHQLRGRVGRGEHAGRCLLVADESTDEAAARIEAMLESNDGYFLAVKDLEIRGQGTLFGDAQSGVADLRLADIVRDADILEVARTAAEQLMAQGRDSEAIGAVMEEVGLFHGALPEARGLEVES
ncbi:MAG: ATP-dependent DNA helicase RecG [Acidimicrobiia bacterium]|nr:ATP-dependent DNA helicase RecG [Acidimicrobiia bacterium]